jgi:hypothetical protein
MLLTSLHHLQRLFLCIWLLTHSFSKKSKYKKKKKKNQNLQRDQI